MADSSALGCMASSKPAYTKRRFPRRREKYAARACTECQRRKIKCSGDSPCRNCRTSRNRVCSGVGLGKPPGGNSQTTSRERGQIHSTNCDILLPGSPDGARRTQLHKSRLTKAAHEQNSNITAQGFTFHANSAGSLDLVESLPSNICTSETMDIDISSYEQPILPYAQVMDPVSSDPSLLRLDSRNVIEQQNPTNDQAVTLKYVVSQLYPDRKLGLFLKCWFDEMDIFYPCIDRADFYERLSALFIEHCTCRNGTTKIPQEPRHLYLAALTCAMISVAVYIGGGAEPHHQLEEDDYYRNSSMSWYLESQRLLSCIPDHAREPNFDLLRLQVVAVLFMTILENKAQVSQAMALAVELAFALQLNDESAWMGLSTRQKEHRRLQWWTVYHLDRRVALSVGRPILIRESEFSVEEYTTESFKAYTSEAERLVDQVEQQCMLLQWATPSARTFQWFDYLQFLLNWDKLVAQVWDNLFSLRAVKQLDAVHIETSDKLLTRLQNNLPPSLIWNYKSLPLSMQLGSVDIMFRLRLIVFETINMLRLLIRSSSSDQTQLEFRQAQQSAQITESIASNTIVSVTSYLKVRQHARPWATYGSLLLVEATSHIAPLLKSRGGAPTETTYKLIDSIIQAQGCLESINIKVSRGAAQRLAAVLDNVSDIFTTFSSNTLGAICAPVNFGIGEHSWQDDQAYRD